MNTRPSVEQSFPVVTQKIADFRNITPDTQSDNRSNRISRNLLDRLPSWIVSLPASYGEVQNVNLSAENRQSPFIVLIQDAHQIYPAQKSIANILEHLQSAGPLMVGLEGAAGDFGLAPYRKNSNREDHEAICDYLMRDGIISGSEYFGLTSSALPVLRGVEDQKLYLSNVDAYRRGMAVKDELEKNLNEIGSLLGPLKGKIYNAQLKELDGALEAYASGRLDLMGYVQALGLENARSKDFPNLTLLRNVFSIEKKMDFPGIENERKQFIEKLSRRLTEADITGMVDHSAAFKAGKIGCAAYYSYLKDVSRGKGVDLADYPGFDQYVSYVLSAERIDRFGLFQELDQLKENVLSSINLSRNQSELLRMGEDLRLVRRLAARELNADEWSRYLTRRGEIEKINLRIIALARTSGASLPGLLNDVPGEGRRFSETLKEFELFYRTAEARNDVMLRNFLDSCAVENRSSLKTAAIVVGGFHSAGIERLLRERKMSFATVVPKFEAVGGGANYLDAFALNKLPLERLLLGDKLDLSPPHALAAPVPGFEYVQTRFALLSAILRVAASFLRNGELTEEDRNTISSFPGYLRVDLKARRVGTGVRADISILGDGAHTVDVRANLDPVPASASGNLFRFSGKTFRIRISWPSQWIVRTKAWFWNGLAGDKQQPSPSGASLSAVRAVSSDSLKWTVDWIIGLGVSGFLLAIFSRTSFALIVSGAGMLAGTVLFFTSLWLAKLEERAAVMSTYRKERGLLFWFDVVARKRLLEKSIVDAWLHEQWHAGGIRRISSVFGPVFLGILLIEEVLHAFNTKLGVKDINADEFRARAGMVFSVWLISIGVLHWLPLGILAAAFFAFWGFVAIRASTDASEFEYNLAEREKIRMRIVSLFHPGVTSSMKIDEIYSRLINVPEIIVHEVIMELLANESEVFESPEPGNTLVVKGFGPLMTWLDKQRAIDRLLDEKKLFLAADVFLGNEAMEEKYDELARLMRLLRADRGLSSPRDLAGVANQIGALMADAYKILNPQNTSTKDEPLLIVNAGPGSAPFSNTFRRQFPLTHMVFAWPLVGRAGAVHLDIRDENGAIEDGSLPDSIVLMDTQLRSGTTLINTMDELLRFYGDKSSVLRKCTLVIPVMSREGLLTFQEKFKDRNIDFTFLTAETVDVEALEKDGAQTGHSKYGDLSQRFASFLLRIQNGAEQNITIDKDVWKIIKRMGATVYQVQDNAGKQATLTWTANVEKLSAIENVWQAAIEDRQREPDLEARGKVAPWVPDLYKSYNDSLVVVREFIPMNLRDVIEDFDTLDDARKREMLLHWVGDIGRMLAWYRSHKLPMPSLRPEDLQLRWVEGQQLHDSHIVSVSIAGNDEKAQQETVQALQSFLNDYLDMFTPEFIAGDQELARLQTWLDNIGRKMQLMDFINSFISLTHNASKEKKFLQFRDISPFMERWLKKQATKGRRVIEFFWQQFADQEMAILIANRNAADNSDVAVGWDLNLKQEEGKPKNLDDVIQMFLALGALKQDGSRAKSIRLAIPEQALFDVGPDFQVYLPYLFALVRSMVGVDGLVILAQTGAEIESNQWLSIHGLDATVGLDWADPYSNFTEDENDKYISAVLSVENVLGTPELAESVAEEINRGLDPNQKKIKHHSLTALDGWHMPALDQLSEYDGKRVVLVYGHQGNFNEGVVELLLTLAALKAAGARVTLVAPYLRYVRQDGITKEAYDIGTCISAETHLRLLHMFMGDDGFFVNLHLSKTLDENPSYMSTYAPQGLKPIKYHNVNALPLMLRIVTGQWAAKGIKRDMIVAVSPDEGFSNFVLSAADPQDGDDGFSSIVFHKVRLAGAPSPKIVGVLDKHMKGPDKEQPLVSPQGRKPFSDVRSLAGKIACLMDDISSTGGTQIEVANYILRQGRLGEEWGPWIWQTVKDFERFLNRLSGGKVRFPMLIYQWMGLPYDFQAVVVHGVFAKGLKETFWGSPIDYRNVIITDSLITPVDMDKGNVARLAELIVAKLRGAGFVVAPSPSTPSDGDAGGRGSFGASDGGLSSVMGQASMLFLPLSSSGVFTSNVAPFSLITAAVLVLSLVVLGVLIYRLISLSTPNPEQSIVASRSSTQDMLDAAIPEVNPVRFLTPAELLRSRIITARGNYSEWAGRQMVAGAFGSNDSSALKSFGWKGNISYTAVIGKILNPRIKWNELKVVLNQLWVSISSVTVRSLFSGETPLVVNLTGISQEAAEASLPALKLLVNRRSPVYIISRGDSTASVLQAKLASLPNIYVLAFENEGPISWKDVSSHSKYQSSPAQHSNALPRFVRHPNAQELSGLPDGAKEDVLYELFSKTLDLLRRVDELISQSA